MAQPSTLDTKPSEEMTTKSSIGPGSTKPPGSDSSLPPLNILVFCDTTGEHGPLPDGQQPVQGGPPKGVATSQSTNILRLLRATTRTCVREGEKERSQIVFYQSGVKADTDLIAGLNLFDKSDKAFGTAIAHKVRDAYSFIAQNYSEGDEISLFGFSQGAYIACKVSELIDRLGLLSPSKLGKFFTYWKQLYGKLPGEPPRPAKAVPIKCLVVWDSVALVRPSVMGVRSSRTPSEQKLPGNVEHAYHAIAFHEERPVLICTPFSGANSLQQLKQVWFSGTHTDVGGGYAETELADITLAWVVGEISKFVGIDTEFVKKCMSNKPNKPNWGESEPYNPSYHWLRNITLFNENRLSLINANSVLHPSLLHAPKVQGLISIFDLMEKLGATGLDSYTCDLNEFEESIKNSW